MKNILAQTLIETLVRRTIKEVNLSPRRSVRNLVDMALDFSDGRFQRHFFEIAQDMLSNENSAYYELIPEAASHIDIEKIVKFGVNVGYNSCTYGARIIRKAEETEQCNIPWSVMLSVDSKKYLEDKEFYNSVISQGKSLGIYTWIIFCDSGIEKIIDIAKENDECAFIFYCTPVNISRALLEKAENINNAFFAVEYSKGIDLSCRMLHEKKFLYSVYYKFSDENINDIFSGKYFEESQRLNSLFTAFVPMVSCSNAAREKVYKYLKDTRIKQLYNTIPWDSYYDSCFVDSIVSDDSCFASFDAEGYLWTYQGRYKKFDYNLYTLKLIDIFRQVFKKQ